MNIPRRRLRHVLSLRLLIVAVVSIAVAGAFYFYDSSPEQGGSLLGNQQNSAAARPDTDETPVSAKEIQNYKTAADVPRLISISAQSGPARVLSLGRTAKDAVDTPKRIYDTGWFRESSKPNQNGAVLIDGHVSGPNKPGVFKNLSKLKVGDEIKLETGDGTVYRYRVGQLERVAYDSVDMKKVLTPTQGAKRGLNLMTCSGRFDKARGTFSDRTIVYSVAITP